MWLPVVHGRSSQNQRNRKGLNMDTIAQYTITSTRTGEVLGVARYHLGGITCNLKDSTIWRSVEQAIFYLLREKAACGVTMSCGVTVTEIEVEG